MNIDETLKAMLEGSEDSKLKMTDCKNKDSTREAIISDAKTKAESEKWLSAVTGWEQKGYSRSMVGHWISNTTEVMLEEVSEIIKKHTHFTCNLPAEVRYDVAMFGASILEALLHSLRGIADEEKPKWDAEAATSGAQIAKRFSN